MLVSSSDIEVVSRVHVYVFVLLHRSSMISLILHYIANDHACFINSD